MELTAKDLFLEEGNWEPEQRWGTMSFHKARRRQRRANWLRMHGRYERYLYEKVLNWLENQSKVVAAAIAVDEPSRFALDRLNVPRETEILLEAISPVLYRAMLTAANSIREDRAVQKAAEDWQSLEGFAIELPPEVVSGIRAAMVELRQETFWQTICQGYKRNLAILIEAGVRDGKSNREIASQIRTETRGAMGKKRAIAVARTEATGALNRGHLESLNQLAEHDADTKKVWSTILDDRTRDSHASMSLETRPVNELFSNGGMYPGDPRLSAAERANCRCCLVGDFPD